PGLPPPPAGETGGNPRRSGRQGRAGELRERNGAPDAGGRHILRTVQELALALRSQRRGTSTSRMTTDSIRPPWRLTVCSTAQADRAAAWNQTAGVPRLLVCSYGFRLSVQMLI